MQKILFQRLSLLLLMLLGGTFSSQSSETDPMSGEDISISFSSEFSEQTADLSEIGLSAVGYQLYDTRQYFLSADFSSWSSYEAILASEYIFYSFQIDPGLDDRDIVFPFHFFF